MTKKGTFKGVNIIFIRVMLTKKGVYFF